MTTDRREFESKKEQEEALAIMRLQMSNCSSDEQYRIFSKRYDEILARPIVKPKVRRA